ncbi:3-methyl-2-oxobutanoate hydroxymethyltransferase [Alicyclobacillus fastidiosus]|uniref:3-methyl-2-oxobutanoate hydroxymethyltransferase n=1 Tax=Alicyclobacillus fastidiosus TaxID=392011 RepID=A0ABY6ZFH2_9BACL|nr:3-methyl-2-oxobutanoate hydroxymethyltransferase [Alicyclobacillus fastidiosus]WAH41485.1 3-methyl-2-oxobutanoate hydroxymethyltransferase [Alicyclobacillus fastidiosus]
MRKKVTVRTLLNMKKSGERIAMMTAYDFPTANLLSDAGLHVLLIGDSLGMVVQGHDTTVPVTVDHMVYHTNMVSRGADGPLIVTDLPFMSYHASLEVAMRNAARIMQEGGAHAVKLEGGREMATTVSHLVDAGVPVMAHIGLTPQSVHALGGFALQGKTLESAQRILDDALALEAAGAFAIVLEAVPAQLAALVTQRLTIPTIGIGAGPGCDGQVLVFHDFIGYTSGYIPKHNKRFADLADMIQGAAKAYVEEVTNGTFPEDAQTVRLDADAWDALSLQLKGEPDAAN